MHPLTTLHSHPIFNIEYSQWLKDSRGKHATLEENQEYPCIKCYTTLDAPIEEVCEYLSQEAHMPEYNDLVVAYRDLEDITPSSKITWSQCPQILFIKPRDFVTYCSHRWRKDGTQIVVSQACEHVDTPANEEESDDKPCRAYALRGANCKLLSAAFLYHIGSRVVSVVDDGDGEIRVLSSTSR